jgi:cytochrome c oxidase subunit 2
MSSKVIVQSRAELEAWLKEAGDVLKNNPPAVAGKILYQRFGCNACHSLDGTPVVGPTFKGIWGKTHRFSNAPPHVVDEDYIREHILTPGKTVREGYENKMPSFKGQISDKEIDAIIALIKSLK